MHTVIDTNIFAGAADYIVTRNLRDLARMELRFPGLRVMSPENFLEELK